MQFLALAYKYKHVDGDLVDTPLPKPPSTLKVKALSPSKLEDSQKLPEVGSENARPKSLSPPKQENKENPFLNIINMAKKKKQAKIDDNNARLEAENDRVHNF